MKIKLTLLQLFVCMSAAAQNVGEIKGTLDRFFSKDVAGCISVCPGEFGINQKGSFVEPKDDHYGELDIYDDDLDLIKHISLKLNKFITYREIYSKDEDGSYTLDSRDDDETTVEPICPNYYDNGSEHEPLVLTQTLFNDDDKYEYIRPIVGGTYNYTRTYDWGTQEKGTELYYAGFEIVSEDGMVLQSIPFEGNNKYNNVDAELIRLSDKYYLAVEVSWWQDENNDNGHKTIFYSLGKSTSSIKKVNSIQGMRVSPSVTKRSQPVTINFGTETNGVRDVTVTGAGGQIIGHTTVPEGQTSVTLDTSRWAKGMNIVTAKCGNNKSESRKVIIE